MYPCLVVLNFSLAPLLWFWWIFHIIPPGFVDFPEKNNHWAFVRNHLQSFSFFGLITIAPISRYFPLTVVECEVFDRIQRHDEGSWLSMVGMFGFCWLRYSMSLLIGGVWDGSSLASVIFFGGQGWSRSWHHLIVTRCKSTPLSSLTPKPPEVGRGAEVAVLMVFSKSKMFVRCQHIFRRAVKIEPALEGVQKSEHSYLSCEWFYFRYNSRVSQ